MSTTAIIMMILVMGVLWGGFILTLLMAMKKEAQKSQGDLSK